MASCLLNSDTNYNKLIILGFDGVIFETNLYHFLSWKKTMKHINRYVDDKHRRNITGLSRIKSLDYFIETFDLDLSLNQKEDLLSLNEEYYRNFIGNLTATDIPPNIFELIHWLRSNGYKISILPNSKFVIDILTKFDMIQLFDYVPTKISMEKANNNVQEVITDICFNLDVKQYNSILIDVGQQNLDIASQMLLRTIGIGHDRKLNGVLEQLEWTDELTPTKIKSLLERVFVV